MRDEPQLPGDVSRAVNPLVSGAETSQTVRHTATAASQLAAAASAAWDAPGGEARSRPRGCASDAEGLGEIGREVLWRGLDGLEGPGQSAIVVREQAARSFSCRCARPERSHWPRSSDRRSRCPWPSCWPSGRRIPGRCAAQPSDRSPRFTRSAQQWPGLTELAGDRAQSV